MYLKIVLVGLLFIASGTNGDARIEISDVSPSGVSSRERAIFNCAFSKKSGVHRLRVDEKSASFDVLCDAGWTVVLNRYDGSVNFEDHTWNQYRRGFGDFQGEFFMGLDKLHALAYSRAHKVTFLMTDFQNETKVASYVSFHIEDDRNDFQITLSGFSGDADDGFSYGARFCAFDRTSPNNYFSQGWHEGELNSFIFAKYHENEDSQSPGHFFCWGQQKYNCKPLRSLKMLVRPVNNYINRN